MTDMWTKEKRSEVMSLIRSKNTKAELIVFRYLRQNRVYFQAHYTRILGKPDIALPRKKKAVFIDGDFWHGRLFDKKLSHRPSNDYWVLKITRNVERDKRQRQELIEKGWSLLAVWESDILRKRTQQGALKSIRDFLLA